MTMLLMLACLAIWALVGLMLGDARLTLINALCGVQTGGWMPSGSVARLAPSRALTRA